jgi:uncharacterized protein (DUF302 family)
MAATIKTSRHAFAETVSMLAQAIAAKGNTIFATIDQAAAAKSVGLTLRRTTLIVFGNPKAGTGLMDAFPLLALDLPLKLLVWEEEDAVRVAYVSMSEIAKRYGVTDFAAQIDAMDHALGALTDSVT